MIALEHGDGFLFVGADRRLYCAIYDPEGFWNDPSYGGDKVNGWTVEHLRPEFWGRAFPEVM